MSLNDLPLSRLKKALRDTKRLLGPSDPTVELIRRAIRKKLDGKAVTTRTLSNGGAA